MRFWTFSLLALALTAKAVQAHQIWIIPTPKGDAAVVVWNDSPEPDNSCEKVTTIAEAKVFLRSANGSVDAQKWTLDKDVYRLNCPGEDARTLAVIWESGDFYFATANLPDKAGKWQPPPKDKAWERVTLEITACPDRGAGTYQVLFQGRPLAGALVLSHIPDMTTGKPIPRTDKDGLFTFRAPKDGVYGLRVRHKANDDKRTYYSTLVIQLETKPAK